MEGPPIDATEHSKEKAMGIWAITITLFLASIAWAVASYFMEREKWRARVELARLENGGHKL